MPEVTHAPAARTKKVSTTTIEEVPVSDKSERSLGMPALDYLRELPEDELGLCDVYVYRVEPKTVSTYIDKLNERLDENLLEERYGGRILAVKIQHKNGKSGYQPRIQTVGEPKYTRRELIANPSLAPASAPSAAGSGISEATLNRLIDKLLDERLGRDASGGLSSAVESTVKMMESASQHAIDVVAKQIPDRTGPNDVLTAAKELVSLIQPRNEKNSILETIAVLKELGILGASAQPKSILEQITELRELKDFLSGDEAGGGPSKKSNGWDVLNTLVEKTPQLFDRTVFLAEQNLKRKQAAAATAARAQQAAAETAAPQTLPPRAPTTPESTLPQAAVVAADPDEPFKRRVVEMIREDTDPVIALNFIEGWNPALAAMLHMFTTEQVRNFIATDPFLSKALDLANFNDWFEAFLEDIAEDKKTAAQTEESSEKTN